jgi:hypothetical protein
MHIRHNSKLANETNVSFSKRQFLDERQQFYIVFKRPLDSLIKCIGALLLISAERLPFKKCKTCGECRYQVSCDWFQTLELGTVAPNKTTTSYHNEQT